MSGYQYNRLRILVVDDNPHMRSLICTALQAFGVLHLQEAENGEDALAVLRSRPFDIVLLDWVMPGMSGIDVTRYIRNAATSPNPFLPIVMITGHASLDHVRAARDAGVNEFLTKPISAKGLLSRLQSIIEHPRAFVKAGTYFGPCRRRRRDAACSGGGRRANDTKLNVA